MFGLPKLRVGHVTDAHVTRLLIDTLIVVVCPIVFMFESGLANGMVYAGGHLGWDLNSFVALLRGFALEGFIFAMFKTVNFLVLSGNWKNYPIALVALFFGLAGMLNSAGCSLIWMNQTGEFGHFGMLSSQFMGPQLGHLASLSLALLFPLGVGAFAIFDVKHMIHEAYGSIRYKTRSLKVRMAEEGILQVEKEVKKQTKLMAPEYAKIVKANTERLVNSFRNGDDSFGLNETIDAPASPSVRRISPAQQGALPAGSVINGQFGPAGPSMGNTQPIQFPQPPTQQFPPQPQQGQGWGQPYTR